MSDKVISLKNASIYQHNKCILKDINLEIDRGELVYLIGDTGSGKSSLLKTLYADIPAIEGELHIAGYDLRKIKKREIPMLRRKLGIVFQDFQLLSDRNVEDNLSFVLYATGNKNKSEISKKIDEVLDLVGLKDKRKYMPYKLSGGQQQCIVIARALLNDPDIILADEPTGNLDPETSSVIMEILFKIKDKGKTILMATHDYNLISKSIKLNEPQRFIRCEDGKIIDKEIKRTKEDNLNLFYDIP